MKYELSNGSFYVKGEMTDVFEVVIGSLNDVMFLTVYLTPNEHTKMNGVEVEIIHVDLLNETIPQALIENGYTIITEEQIGKIQNHKYVVEDWIGNVLGEFDNLSDAEDFKYSYTDDEGQLEEMYIFGVYENGVKFAPKF